MKKKFMTIAGMATVLAVCLPFTACSAPGKVPPIGSPLPPMNLTDVKGQTHSLDKYKGSIVVLNFMSQECPYSCGVDTAMPELAKTYAAKGVVFLGIDSHKSTTAEQIKQYIDKAKLPYPVLKDTGNAYADAVGATRTPEFYIIDKDQKLAYHGAFDNRKVPEKAGDINYVKDALEDLLAGRPVKTPEVAAWGCTIKRAS